MIEDFRSLVRGGPRRVAHGGHAPWLDRATNVLWTTRRANLGGIYFPADLQQQRSIAFFASVQ